VSYLIVFIGAGLGGALRHGVNQLAGRLLGLNFPHGTLIVNVLGSFAMGMVIDYYALRGEASQPWRLFLATGVLGGFTTFSTYSLDVALLWGRGEGILAGLYAIGSVVASIAALYGGMSVMRGL
jgi:CrcB protein